MQQTTEYAERVQVSIEQFRILFDLFITATALTYFFLHDSVWRLLQVFRPIFIFAVPACRTGIGVYNNVMYLQHFGFEHSPFTRRPNPDVFFAQAGRKKIMTALHHDLRQGHAAMLLTGPEGSGKTLFCQQIQHYPEERSNKIVYLENPVGSFNQLLRQICRNSGMSLPENMEQENTAVLEDILEKQKKQGRHVVLLIDEAEKMFLAALERLFHLLNRMNKDYGMQILLVGRSALKVSVEQLSAYCEDVSIASSYNLKALSAAETAAYLSYRLKTAGNAKGAERTVFAEKAVQEIFRLSKGLPGVIDGIAETALQNAASAQADTVLPVHVVVPDDPVAGPAQGGGKKTGSRKAGLLFVLFLILLTVFLFGRRSFFSFFPHQEETAQEAVQEPVRVVPENTEISIAVPEVIEELPLPIEEKDKIVSSESSQESSPASQDIEKTSLFARPVPQHPVLNKEGDKKEAVSSKAQQAAPKAPIQIQSIAEEKPSRQKNITQSEQRHEERTEKVVQGKEKESPDATAVPVLSPEDLKQAAQTASSAEASTEARTAKHLPVIPPARIIILQPRMKKTRPTAAEKSVSTTARRVREARRTP
ncbi:MAG: AAA family ATPase, partial [Candidatus Electrothrix sp. EH2]|nr:AAA family ATPase [Candidatus Electrothrix sp. EH2]